jgi:crotonobetainyl-CoA:carnitine CoA-transferase CaiB-like acyl-CoA transferase
VYDVFTVRDGEQIFLAAVSDAQWRIFCDLLGFDDLKADLALKTNNDRVRARPRLLQVLRDRLAQRSAAELSALFEQAGLPFAPIRKPEDLYDDPHLLATGGLADVVLPDGEQAGKTVKTTLFPITLDGQRLPVRLQPPVFAAHTEALLEGLGYARGDIDALRAQSAVA